MQTHLSRENYKYLQKHRPAKFCQVILRKNKKYFFKISKAQKSITKKAKMSKFFEIYSVLAPIK